MVSITLNERPTITLYLKLNKKISKTKIYYFYIIMFFTCFEITEFKSQFFSTMKVPTFLLFILFFSAFH